ncbi:hypothetical protein HMPREF9554_02978 [Treponema phagedenis F0421]|nr:hypothetical protein HMPREF9554_02978 [Treponema phagedenis F0421]
MGMDARGSKQTVCFATDVKIRTGTDARGSTQQRRFKAGMVPNRNDVLKQSVPNRNDVLKQDRL